MFRLAHISDLHYFGSLRVPARRLMGKRITGYLNLVLNRRFQHRHNLTQLMLEEIRRQKVDHLAVTGDLTHLSLGSEFAEIREMLLLTGLPWSEISVVPGNHDRYTKGAAESKRFEGYMAPFVTSNIDFRNLLFPFVRLRGDVAIIGLDSSLHLPPFIAKGEIGAGQLTRLEVVMHHLDLRGRFKVFLMHHPPYRHLRRSLHQIGGLRDYRDFYSAVQVSAGLILHGHVHRNVLRRVDTATGSYLISGVASSSSLLSGFGSDSISSFNIYELDGRGLRSLKRYRLNQATMTYEYDEIADGEFLPTKI